MQRFLGKVAFFAFGWDDTLSSSWSDQNMNTHKTSKDSVRNTDWSNHIEMSIVDANSTQLGNMLCQTIQKITPFTFLRVPVKISNHLIHKIKKSERFSSYNILAFTSLECPTRNYVVSKTTSYNFSCSNAKLLNFDTFINNDSSFRNGYLEFLNADIPKL